jgi:hypothetical protein
MKKRLAIPTAGLAVVSLLLWGVEPAFAAGSTAASDNAIAAIQAVAPSVLKEAVPAQKRAPSKALSKFASGDASASLSPEASTGITTTSAGRSITIGLPSRARSVVTATGMAAFDNDDNSVVVPVLKTNGSVQVVTVSANANAPTRYAYPVILQKGQTLSLLPSGQVVLLDAVGNALGMMTAPWALDATGNPVPTRYEVTGNVVTQVVDLYAPGIVFPVVADPTFVWIWGGYGYHFNKAETKHLAANAPTTDVAILCGVLPAALALGCGALVVTLIGTWSATMKHAASVGRCIQFNYYYVLPPWIAEVSC